MAAGVQQLCTELGPSQTVGDDGQPVQQGSLLSEIRQLLVENKGREDGVVALHGSVNGLMAAVEEDIRQGAEMRNGFSKFCLSRSCQSFDITRNISRS